MASLSYKGRVLSTATKKYYVSYVLPRLFYLKHTNSNVLQPLSIGQNQFGLAADLGNHTVIQHQRSFYTSAYLNIETINKVSHYSTSIISNQVASRLQENNSLSNHVTINNQQNLEDGESGVSQALHRLNLNVQRTGRAYMSNVKAIFSSVKTNGKCTSNEALLLLRCCGNFLTDEKASVRSELSEKIWEYLQNSGVPLDSSHYNALLKNRLDNEVPNFQPSEFLGLMEKNGVEANRVTFQHLIAKYCSSGDIQGATTILEHMKQQRLPVNENVFHSLIVGHCRAGNFEDAKNVMSIMVDSSVDVDSDTRMIYVLELARAGKDFQKELSEITGEGIQLSDHELFKLIVLLLEKGEKESAAHVASMLPKKRGFFQEMRNFIPSMISTGELEIPFNILSQFTFPTALGSEGHAESGRADHGLFFLNAMVKNEYDPKSLIEYAKKLESSESNIANRILENCIEHGNIHYGQSVFDLIITEFGKDVIDPGNSSNFVRSRANFLQKMGPDPSSIAAATVEFLLKMGAIGLRPLPSDLSQSIMPNLMASDALPGQIMLMIHKTMDEYNNNQIEMKNPIPYSQIANSMLQYLLNQETQFSFARAVGYITSMNVPTRPHLWNAGLARSFLVTGCKDSLVSMLTLNTTTIKVLRNVGVENKEKGIKNDEDIFQTLNQIIALIPRYRPESNPSEILLPVLQDLHNLKVGVPETIASMIKRNIEEPSQELNLILDELQSMYDDNSCWTEGRVNNLVYQRKKKAFNLIGVVRPDHIEISKHGFIEKDKIPTDLKGLERVQGVLKHKKLFNLDVIDKLVTMYVENEDIEKAETLIERSLENKHARKYHVLPHTVYVYIRGCVKNNHLQKAEVLLKKVGSSEGSLVGNSVQISCYIDLAKALADQGDHDKVLEIFNSIDVNCLTDPSFKWSNIFPIVEHYIRNEDLARAKNVYELLQEKNIIKMNKTFEQVHSTLSSQIENSKTETNIQEEIEKFENIAKEENRIIDPMGLLKKLAILEDTDGIQRVLDASINVIGEERSVYNLAVSFIETGKLTQAKKLLATPGLRYDHWKMKFVMDRYSQRGLLDEMGSLVLFSRPIFACDREYMYSTLITACAKAKQYKRIQEAWVDIQEEDFGPSDSLKIQIANALQAGELPVPFTVPEETQIRDTKKPVFAEKGEEPFPDKDTLLEAINERDTTKVMNAYKKLVLNKSLSYKDGLKVAEYIALIPDTNQQNSTLQNIFEDEHLVDCLALRYASTFYKVIDKYDRAQLESLWGKVEGSKAKGKYHWMYGKLSQLHINEDVESFLSTLDSNGNRIPSHRLLKQVIESSQNNAEKLFDICLESSNTNPKLSIETIKACLTLDQHSNMVSQIWKKIENQELTRDMFRERSLSSCNKQELLPVKDFYISCLSNESLNDMTKNSLKGSVAFVYNKLIDNALNDISAESNNPSIQERPDEILDEALGKWITLDW